MSILMRFNEKHLNQTELNLQRKTYTPPLYIRSLSQSSPAVADWIVIAQLLISFLLTKADYGNYGERKYPTYGDYYRTHRYPINDGWMLWDEDLRDKDTAKADKFGSGKKDGGR